jgi:dCTP deaminase
MLLKTKALESLLKETGPDSLSIVPMSNLVPLPQGAASIDLRLGRWFTSLRSTKMSLLDVSTGKDQLHNEHKMTKQHYVRFGETFVLHPGKFVLGVTLEWIRLPASLGAFVGGKSSWGRRGLIIETAAGIHPGFCGCLTLEMTNLGEVPIAIVPGMPICQVVFHQVSDKNDKNASKFHGKRKPTLGTIQGDAVLDKLSKALT